jgi:GxxExxY protein
VERLALSARSIERVRRLARTIADMEGSAQVRGPHVVEALTYRSLDREATSMAAAEGTEAEERTEMSLNHISGSIIGAAIEVHRALGPGLLESAYHECLVRELIERGHHVERERSFPVVYSGAVVRRRFRLDLAVDDRVLVEIKAVKHLLPVHESQILSYLRLLWLVQFRHGRSQNAPL